MKNRRTLADTVNQLPRKRAHAEEVAVFSANYLYYKMREKLKRSSCFYPFPPFWHMHKGKMMETKDEKMMETKDER